jgi:hypothetical protein
MLQTISSQVNTLSAYFNHAAASISETQLALKSDLPHSLTDILKKKDFGIQG